MMCKTPCRATRRPRSGLRTISLLALSTGGVACLALALCSPPVLSRAYTLGSFVYFGLDNGPLYWSYKCADTAYAAMLGDLCRDLPHPDILVMPVLADLDLDAETAMGRALKVLLYLLKAVKLSFLSQAERALHVIDSTQFLCSIGLVAGFVVIYGTLLYADTLKTQLETDALAYLREKASFLQEADVLKSRLVNSNAKVASLQFELVQLKQPSQVMPAARKPEHFAAELDAIREALRNSEAAVLAVRARNRDAELEAQLKVLGDRQLLPASSPNHTEDALKVPLPFFQPAGLISSSSASSDVTLMPSSNRDSRLPLTRGLSSTSSISMIATPPSGSSHTLSTPNGTPITPPLVSRHRRISPLLRSISTISSPLSTRSPLEVRLAARRSLFSVGVRTPECVFKGKVRARVSRSTRKALREKENVGVRAVEVADVDEVE